MTIKDIARLAGCGVSTVSRALKYNYTPNGNARRMRQTAPNSVLLIVNGSSNLFFSPLIEQIQTAAENAGLQLVVNYIDEQEDEVQTAAQLCVEQKPAGIIFLGGDIRNFRRSFAGISVPCVLSTASAKELGFANLSSVSVDDVDGGRMAAEELFRLGHRSIGILGGDLDSGPSGLRYSGAETPVCEQCSYTFSSAYEAAIALFHRCKDMSAVFAMSDIIAVGAVRAFLDMGKRVPQDISVVGFDGIDIADFTNPRIATFSQPIHQISSLSVRMLVNMIENSAEASHVTLRAQYKAGDSVCMKRTEVNE